MTILAFALAVSQEAQPFARHWRPGDCVSYTLRVAGEEAGLTWTRYSGGERLHRFVTKMQLDGARLGIPEAGQIRSQSILDLDEAGLPVRYESRTQMPTGQVVAVIYEFLPASVTVSSQGHSRHVPLENGPAPLLENNVIAHLDIYLGGVDLAQERVEGRLFSASALRTIPYTIRIAREANGSYRFEDSLRETITYDAQQGIVSLTASGGALEFRRDSTPREPEFELTPEEPLRYERPADATWTDEPVRIVRVGDNAVILAGTLSLPPGAGHHPAAFFISGSGTQDRHGFGAGIDVGTHEVLDALAAAGFAVLRMDDRGAGESGAGGVAADIGYLDLVEDARASLAWLRQHRAVDPERVFLVGHSEGAITAAILAGEGGVAGVVSMAGPGRNLRELTAWQAERLVSPEAAERLRRLWEYVARGEDPPLDVVPPQGMEQFLGSRKWLRDHARLDVAGTWGRVQVPLLVLQGLADVQVSPDEDAARVERLAREAGNSDVTLRTFEGLDHLFKPCAAGADPLAQYADRSRRIDPAFLRALVDWLQARR